MRQGARWGAVLVAIGLLMGPLPSVRAADDPEDEEIEDGEETEAPVVRGAADVKIEVKLESGRVVKPESAVHVDYGVQTGVELQADGSKHQFQLTIMPKGDGKKEVAITVGYDRDGEPIVAPYTFDAKVKKREVLRIEGGMALAFTITPKKVDGEQAPAPDEEQPTEPVEKPKPKDKIEVCEEDDPLCGIK
ncbi:hypothetical protein [Paraliomyxa miuraensis]|uniref:hypothetical protein n=1 Tax=Paraliomyxa miuraensis TaxID=376150 RepID=UPI00225A5177|nr:hypothetical protein [Paraliomyxa miuraensis]MCX4241128.1 hypothetical protein [Paraliomyxa miuraensis]